MLRCTSCNVDVLARPNYVRFPCPSCGKFEIVRCSRCKSLSIPYKCKCGFVGP
jgi:hypothetical protein